VGEEVPVLTQTRNIQGGETIRSFDFKQVAIELEVTPRINPGREVFLKVHPLVKKILGFNAELGAPILATREAQTSVQVLDGQTVVIGGLMKDDRSSSQSKIPILGDIPLIGYLFKKHGSTSEKTELLVFVTPRVIDNAREAEAVTVRKEAESRAKTTPHRGAARGLLREGKRLYRARRYAEARRAFEEAERTSPDGRVARSAAPFKVVGNLPYNLTSPILRKLSEWTNWSTAVVMVQKEVGDRLSAKVGTAEYGALTVGMGVTCTMERIFELSEKSFDPPPRVKSVVVRLRRRAEPLYDDPERVTRVIQAAFQQRRKTIENSFSHGLGFDKALVRDALADLKLDPMLRAERLTVEDFIRVTRKLMPSC
jgi:16S rRNA A1518/A1519 N6-dimethyltransferase RsmA/KsgA/DIM1 with predicted DNA glycosylase/AP lyase activity